MSEWSKEAAIERVDQYSEAMTPERTISTFPFLRLPLEIRVYIYRHLLSTRPTSTQAYKDGDYSWPFKFAPAILQANKQVFGEASRVLYTENDFVVLQIATHIYSAIYSATQTPSLIDKFPNFPGLSEKQIPHPLLSLAITDLNSEPSASQTLVNKRKFIFTLEALPYVIQLLWSMSMFSDMSSIGFTALLFNKVHSRHAYLNNHVVRSLDQLQGFADYKFLGDIDSDVARHLAECMDLGPQLQDVCLRMAGFLSLGEHYFKKRNYALAKRYWTRLRGFWVYCYHFTCLKNQAASTRTRYSGKDFLEATLPIMLEGDLGEHMLGISSQEYRKSRCFAYTLLLAKHIIDQYVLDYRVPPVLQAKFRICESLQQCLVGEKKRSQEFHEMAVTSLCQDPRFAGKSAEVSRELEWARDSFLKQVEDPLKCGEEERETSTPETREVLPEWRSIWEWMDLSE
jgi:hypothetical protein